MAEKNIENRSPKLPEVASTAPADWTKPTAKHGYLVQLFFNVNLIKAHRGLKLIANEYSIDLEQLMPGQYVGFLNRRRTAIKLFTSGNIYAYLRLTDNDLVTADIIRQIPQVFQSIAGLQISPQLRESLEAPIPLSGNELDHLDYKRAGGKTRYPMRLPTGRETK